MSILKIYIIEDDISRAENMVTFFRELQGKINSDLPNNQAGEFLKKQGIGNIETQILRDKSGKKDAKHHDYIYSDDFKKILEEILMKDEERIFIVDLALNNEEREDFSRNKEYFNPETAIKIIEYIGSSRRKERIILNTRLIDMRKKWESVVEIKESIKSSLQVSTMRYSLFADQESDYERDIQMCDTLNRALKD